MSAQAEQFRVDHEKSMEAMRKIGEALVTDTGRITAGNLMGKAWGGDTDLEAALDRLTDEQLARVGKAAMVLSQRARQVRDARATGEGGS